MKAIGKVALAGAVTAALVAAVWAGENHRNEPAGAAVGEKEVRARLEAQGYEVRDVEREHGGFEVEARDKTGKKVELRVSAADGSLIGDDEEEGSEERRRNEDPGDAQHDD